MAKHSEDQPKSTLVKTRKRRDPKRDVEFPRAILFWNAVVACYENKLQEAFIPKKGVVDVWTWSRIRNGTVHPGGSAKKLQEFFGDCCDKDEFEVVYSQNRVLDLESWKPEVGTFEWPPFCHHGGREGFLVDATSRFFRLAGKVAKYTNKPF